MLVDQRIQPPQPQETPAIPLSVTVTSEAIEEDGASSYGSGHQYSLHREEEGESVEGYASPIESAADVPSRASSAINTNISRRGPKLYDRNNQKKLLLDYYERCRSESAKDNSSSRDFNSSAATNGELILVTGNSGMGKTMLASSIQEEVLADGGFFITGKCVQSIASQQEKSQPVSPEKPPHSQQQSQQKRQQLQCKLFVPFVSALTEWGEQVKHPSFAHLQAQIRELVQMDKDLVAAIHVLVENIPSLGDILGLSSLPSTECAEGTKDKEEKSTEVIIMPGSVVSLTGTKNSTLQQGTMQMQFSVVLREFLQILCQLSHRPLVLLLDDLQWADQSSLDLLESLLIVEHESPHTFTGLMLIGTCRPNEVAMFDPLSEMLRRIEERKGQVIEIQCQKLGIQALCSMISDISGLPMSECRTLADTAYHETKGNALFARQYIEVLCRDLNEDYHYGDSSVGDTGSLTSISAAEASDERIVKWLVKQMQRLPADTLYLLQVMSCLGGTFRMDILQRVSLLTSSSMNEFVAIGRERNLIVYDDEKQIGRFAHDKYSEAAYALLTPADRPAFHLLLGCNLMEQCTSDEDLQKYLISIVDLMLVGKHCITDEADRARLAQWCLQVGNKVASSSSFAGPWAIGYMEQGIQLLGFCHWRDQYDLTLSLHNATARLAYCQDNHSRVGELVEEVRLNARSFMDQVDAYLTAIYSLGASGDPDQAMEVGFYVLEELGFPFPRKLSALGVLQDLFKTKRKLRKFCEQDILDLPVNDNRKALVATTVIHMLHPVFAARRPIYTVLTGSRLVRMTLKYGHSPTSTVVFATYSLSLLRLWRLSEAQVYSQLALQLEKRQRFVEMKGVYHIAMGMGPAFLSMPIGQAFVTLEKAHLVCLETGTIEIGVRAHMALVIARFLFGDQLGDAFKALKKCINHCNDYSSVMSNQVLVNCVNGCGVLMGTRTEALDTKQALKMCDDIKIEVILLYALHSYTYVAMIMHKLDFGRQLMIEMRKRKATARALTPFAKMYQVFCEGMLAASLGRKDMGKERLARRRLKCLEALACYNPATFSNKAHLLKAELQACTRKKGQALALYDTAIELSRKHGFVHEEALACEKAARMLLQGRRQVEAEVYLSKAMSLYGQWGAQAKVSQLSELIVCNEKSSFAETQCSSRQGIKTVHQTPFLGP